jgi:biopolymer transport protein ExbB
MLGLINKGGIFMWLLVFIYLGTLAIILERALFFYLTRYDLKEIKERLLKSKSNKSVSEIIDCLKNTMLGRVLEVYFAYYNYQPSKRDDLVALEGDKEIGRMEQYLWGLSLAGHVSPLIGLLGTITGIMATFKVIESTGGQVDITLLSGGIWEAMITTAAGLLVAIPALIAFHFYQTIINKRVKDMQEILAYTDFSISENKIQIDFSDRQDLSREVESYD